MFAATRARAAADQYWDTNGLVAGLGGTGTWNTNALNLVWNNSSGTGVGTFWSNGNNAFFQGTAGTVTVGAAISAASVTLGVSGYTISNSSSNTLTVTSTGTGTTSAINATNTSGTNTISAPVVLGAAASTTQTFTQSSGGTLVISGVISNTNAISGLTLTGGGTYTFSGANTYTNATTINSGTLNVAASSGSALGSTSAITVNSGGTLTLGASDQINNSATMTLAGGTFSKGNFSEGTSSSVGVGALTLTANSHIDFGTGTVGVITFASLNVSTFTLTIDNWTGTANTVGTSSTDRLIFDSDQSSNLSAFQFTGYGPGAVEFDLGNGFFEVTPIPEPGWVLAALAFAVIAYRQGRRFAVRSREQPRMNTNGH